MRKRTNRIPGAILMILLLTAQTMGWCRAYVCECSGSPEVTIADHCHGEPGHEHDDHESPCGHQCGSHHDHEILPGSFSAMQGRDQLAHRLPPLNDFVVVMLPPLSPELIVPENAIRTLRRGHDPSGSLSCRPRHTVAMLI